MYLLGSGVALGEHRGNAFPHPHAELLHLVAQRGGHGQLGRGGEGQVDFLGAGLSEDQRAAGDLLLLLRIQLLQSSEGPFHPRDLHSLLHRGQHGLITDAVHVGGPLLLENLGLPLQLLGLDLRLALLLRCLLLGLRRGLGRLLLLPLILLLLEPQLLRLLGGLLLLLPGPLLRLLDCSGLLGGLLGLLLLRLRLALCLLRRLLRRLLGGNRRLLLLALGLSNTLLLLALEPGRPGLVGLVLADFLLLLPRGGGDVLLGLWLDWGQSLRKQGIVQHLHCAALAQSTLGLLPESDALLRGEQANKFVELSHVDSFGQLGRLNQIPQLGAGLSGRRPSSVLGLLLLALLLLLRSVLLRSRLGDGLSLLLLGAVRRLSLRLRRGLLSVLSGLLGLLLSNHARVKLLGQLYQRRDALGLVLFVDSRNFGVFSLHPPPLLTAFSVLQVMELLPVHLGIRGWVPCVLELVPEIVELLHLSHRRLGGPELRHRAPA
mmetsp:Transcript_23819/g.52480  ORF Transcript_23819/g.52480 Transcript_23819/m.52480 type:complete len:489 (+) Transcript_23819:601-2067(+)